MNHGLFYAKSVYTNNDFKFGGTLISNCDEGLGKKTNYYGNNHGSILSLNGKYYIFYHRQTNKNSFSRQMCAEELDFDGFHFKQAEMTSCGLNGGPLIGKERYKAAIACNLYSTKGTFFYKVARKIARDHAFLTQDEKDNESIEGQYIKNVNNKTIIGYKYFSFDGTESKINVLIKGKAKGKIIVRDKENGNKLAEIPLNSINKKNEFSGNFNSPKGKSALFFTFEGSGRFSFYEFEIK